MKYFVSLFAAVLFLSVGANAQITSVATGNWSAPTTWSGGAVPGPTDDVAISGFTVTIDANAECNNLTINKNLYFDTTKTNLTLAVHGNLTVANGGKFAAGAGTPRAGRTNQLILEKDLTNVGTGKFDMRVGTSATTSVVRIVFSGSTTSTITLTQTAYASSTEEFNSIEINKSNGAKVVLAAGNLFQSNNSSNLPDTLTLVSGVVETGSNYWAMLATRGSAIVGASAASYFHGIIGRALSNTGGVGNFDFPVGDASTYRPINLRINSPANATGHFAWARLVDGDANTGSSTLVGGINNVSAYRYYQVGYVQGLGSATSIPVYGFSPSYTNDDGVVPGNTDLRVAYSEIGGRSTWTNAGPTDHTTSVPSTINSDSLTTAITVNTGTSFYVALASVAGASDPLPVELQAFTAKAVRGTVELAWSTATERNNAGFEIERKADGSWTSIGFVAGAGTSNSPKQYAFAQKNVDAGTYSYRLKQIDRDGKIQYSNAIEVNVAGAPTTLSLIGNYPNPFNPATNVSFTVPAEGRAVVKVFNLIGQEVATIFDETASAGKTYSVPFNAASLPSGIYFSQLQYGGQTMVKKMILMK